MTTVEKIKVLSDDYIYFANKYAGTDNNLSEEEICKLKTKVEIISNEISNLSKLRINYPSISLH